MLLSLVAPSGGKAQVLGRPVGDVETRRKIGFLPEHFRFHEWLTASELLDLHGRLYRIPTARLRERAPALLELVGLAAHHDKPLRDFSKGMLQRIGLAQARCVAAYPWRSRAKACRGAPRAPPAQEAQGLARASER